jgi:hypothetical protein
MYSVLGGKEEIWMVILCFYHRKCTLGRCGQVLIPKFYKGLLWWLGSRLGALDSSFRCLLDLEGEIEF